MSCFCGSKKKDKGLHPSEVIAVVRALPADSKFTAEDVNVIYGKFREIAEGQPTIDFAQFTQVLNSLNVT